MTIVAFNGFMRLAPHPPGNSQRYDGYLMGKNGQPVPPDQPLPEPLGDPQEEVAIYVNGISTGLYGQMLDMQRISKTGKTVVGVHNATQGVFKDVLQSISDKLRRGKNPAVETVKKLIRQAVKSGRDLSLIGHSQGALICSRALWEFRADEMKSGIPASEVTKELSRIKLDTAGGAAYCYPEGPEYKHRVNRLDPIGMLLGLGSGLPGLKFGASSKTETFLRLRKPYKSKSEPWVSFLGKAIDRSVHGTYVYYEAGTVDQNRQKFK